MGSFEGMRDRLSTTDVIFFPDADARNGTIRTTDEQGNPKTILVDVHEQVRKYLDLYPLPNDILLGGGIGRHFASQFLPSDENFFAVRVGHQVSERDSLFVRYSFDDASSRGAGDSFLFQTTQESRQQYATLTGSHVFSPSFLTAYRLGYTRPANQVATLSFIDVPDEDFFVPGAPQFGQIIIPGVTSFGPAATYPLNHKMNTYQLSNDYLVSKGNQSWKMGFDINNQRIDVFSGWFKGAAWSFNNLENFLQAGPRGTNLTVALPGSDNRRSLRQTLYALYVQNEYQASPNLQLSLGLRFEYASMIKDRYGKLVYLEDPVTDPTVQVGEYVQENPSGTFSPRFGLTWSPRDAGSTVISTGSGIYYDQVLAYIQSQRKSSAPFHNISINPNFDATTTFPSAVAAGTGVAPAVQIFDYQHTSTPTVYRYHLSLQQELGRDWRVRAAYVGMRGNHLFRRFETNQFPSPVELADGSLCFPPDAATVPAEFVARNPDCLPASSVRAGPINPSHAAISIIPTDAQSFYNSLQLSGGLTFGSGGSLQASYAFSKSVDDNSTGVVGNVGQFALRRTLDRGLSNYDIRHRFSANYFYSLPFGGGGQWLKSGWMSKVVGDWRLGGIVSYRTGIPYTAGVRIAYPGYLFTPQRPNLVPGGSTNPIGGASSGCGQIEVGRQVETPSFSFDPCMFSAPLPGTLGNVGRNTLIAPSVFNMDVSITRDFLLDSKRRLQFRADIFNLPNHPNFNSASGNSAIVFSGASGNRNSTAGRITQTATTSRQIQFSLRLSF